MGKRQSIKEITHITTDTNGVIINEIKSLTTSPIRAEKEPLYYKVYLDSLCKLKDIPNNASKLLNILVKHMSMTNVIVLNKVIKMLIMREMGLDSMNTFNKSVDQLYKAGFLIRIGHGTYLIDPDLFAKNNWETVKGLRLCIDFLPDGTKKFKLDTAKQLALWDYNEDARPISDQTDPLNKPSPDFPKP